MTRHAVGLLIGLFSVVLAGVASGPVARESAASERTNTKQRRVEPPPATPPNGVRALPSGPCPEEMALVGATCVDRFEAHLVERHPDGSLTPHPAHARPHDGLFAVSRAGVRPQAYISRVEAARACENAGKRLCSAGEWHAACRGPEDRQYPYGERFERDRCNVGKPHLLSIVYGTDPRAWKYDEHFNDPALNQRPGFLAATGEYAGCAGSLGIHDLVGNLHEWVKDDVDRSLAQKLPLTDGIRARLGRNTGKGVFVGGFYSTTHEHGRGCAFVTIAHEPGYHDYSTGFRCCRDRSP